MLLVTRTSWSCLCVYLWTYKSFNSPDFSCEVLCFLMAALEDLAALDEWLSSIGGITEAGRSKLEKAAIVSLTVVKCLTIEDLNEVKLNVGDRAIFRTGWEKITAKVPEKELVEKESPVVPIVPEVEASAKLFSIEEISKFFGQLSTREKTGSVLQQLSGVKRAASTSSTGPQPEGSVAGAAADVNVNTLSKDRLLNRLAADYIGSNVSDSLVADIRLDRGEKPLLPINFATVFNGVVADDEDILGCGTGAGRLVWQSGKGNLRKPTPDRLSYGQFF
jgi:hypothetical protein